MKPKKEIPTLPFSNPFHAPAEHITTACKRLLVLVKRKENIDKTLNFVTIWQEKCLHRPSLQMSINYTAELTLQINLKTRQPDIQNKICCIITFCCRQ